MYVCVRGEDARVHACTRTWECSYLQTGLYRRTTIYAKITLDIVKIIIFFYFSFRRT